MAALMETNYQCKQCGSAKVFTVDSRPANRPGWRRRRKHCNDCDAKWSTVELPIEDIEAVLAITYKLDDLGNMAKNIHETIEQLKRTGDPAEMQAVVEDA